MSSRLIGKRDPRDLRERSPEDTDMLSDEVRVTLIVLAVVVVLGLLVALIGYPMVILVALLATFAVFALMIVASIDDVGRFVRRSPSPPEQRG